MTKLVLKKYFKKITACAYVNYGYLFKEGDRITLKDDSFGDIISVNEPLYGERFVVSPDNNSFLFFPSLFHSSLNLYSLPSLSVIDKIKVDGVLKDACFSHDGKTLYLLYDLEDENGLHSVLVSYDRKEKTKTLFFEKENYRFDSLFFSPVYCCLTLLLRSGQIFYFQDGKIVRKTKTSPFHKIFFRDKGSNLISDTMAGFQISSLNGKVIRKCDFLLPKERKKPTRDQKLEILQNKEIESLCGNPSSHRKRNEHYLDRLVAYTTNQVFYITRKEPERESCLYFFSLNSFRRKKQIKLKGKYFGRNYSKKHLFILTSDGVSLYQLVNDK